MSRESIDTAIVELKLMLGGRLTLQHAAVECVGIGHDMVQDEVDKGSLVAFLSQPADSCQGVGMSPQSESAFPPVAIDRQEHHQVGDTDDP